MEGEPTAAPAEMSEVSRLGGIFFAPAETYQSVARRPSFLLPLALMTVLQLAVTWWIGHRVGWERVVRSQFEQSPQAREMSPEQREQAVQRGARFAGVIGYVSSAVSWWLVALVVSGVLLFVFSVLAGSEIRFAQMFSVVSWSVMPYAVASVLAFVVVGLKLPQEVDVQNLVASNLGALFDADHTAKPLLGLLRSLDVFTAWQLFLLSTGSAAVGKKLSFAQALTWVLISWAVWVGLKVGWYSIFA